MRIVITSNAGDYLTRADVEATLFEPIVEVRKRWLSKYERHFVIADTYKDGVLVSQTIDTL